MAVKIDAEMAENDEPMDTEVVAEKAASPEKKKWSKAEKNEHYRKLRKDNRKKVTEKRKQNRPDVVKETPAPAPRPDPLYTTRTCGGVDLISKPVHISPDSRHIVVNGGDRILVYSSSTGSLVQTLNTGQVVTVMMGTDQGTVIVTTKKKIVVWNYQKVKIVEKKINLFPDGGMNNDFKTDNLVDVFLPADFLSIKEVYLVVKDDKKRINKLKRLNMLDKSQVITIFRNVTVGTVTAGDNNNTLVAISDHREHGYKNATLLCYDRNLRKVQSYHTDKDRPFTVASVHPGQKLVAAGDKSGRILLLSGLGDQLAPARAVMHWHSMPVTALTWSLEGGFLYSGGGERVLVKWRTTDNSRPSFLPRLAGGVVGVSVGVGVTAVQLDDNSVVVLDSQDKPAAQLTGMTRSGTGYPAGLAWDSRARLVVMNGRVGQLQMVNVDTADCVQSLDITQQNYITQERDVTPQNSEVERVAVSDCGGHLATLDCCWTRVPRITLKFWTFNQTTQKFCLNTQVDCPHDGGAVSLRFRPGPSPLLASCGKDSKVKLWQFSPSSAAGGSWSCDSCLTYRGLASGAVSWSSDGTLLAAAFSHVVTLWDKNCRLRTSLSPTEGDAGPVLCLQFGRNSSSCLLVSASSTSLTCWDILTLSPTWVLPLPASSPPLLLTACPSTPRLAVVHKDVILILDPTSQKVLARLSDVNCTGAAVFAPNTTTADPVSCLYYVTYRGVVKRVGPRAGQVKQKTRLVEQKSALKTLLGASRGGAKEEKEGLEQWSRGGRGEDIESMLSLPLHAVPGPSRLQNTVVRNRLLALPKLRLPLNSAVDNIDQEEEGGSANRKIQKYQQMFRFDIDPRPDTDLKSFCKRLKSQKL